MAGLDEILFDQVVKAAVPPSAFEPPHGSGVYAWFLRSGIELCELPVGEHRLVYIGRSDDLGYASLQSEAIAGRVVEGLALTQSSSQKQQSE